MKRFLLLSISICFFGNFSSCLKKNPSNISPQKAYFIKQSRKIITHLKENSSNRRKPSAKAQALRQLLKSKILKNPQHVISQALGRAGIADGKIPAGLSENVLIDIVQNPSNVIKNEGIIDKMLKTDPEGHFLRDIVFSNMDFSSPDFFKLLRVIFVRIDVEVSGMLRTTIDETVRIISSKIRTVLSLLVERNPSISALDAISIYFSHKFPPLLKIPQALGIDILTDLLKGLPKVNSKSFSWIEILSNPHFAQNIDTVTTRKLIQILAETVTKPTYLKDVFCTKEIILNLWTRGGKGWPTNAGQLTHIKESFSNAINEVYTNLSRSTSSHIDEQIEQSQFLSSLFDAADENEQLANFLTNIIGGESGINLHIQ